MEKHVANYNPDWETKEIREARKKVPTSRGYQLVENIWPSPQRQS